MSNKWISGIPVIRPIPNQVDPTAWMGTAQPVIAFKELVVDERRYNEWKAYIERTARKRSK